MIARGFSTTQKMLGGDPQDFDQSLGVRDHPWDPWQVTTAHDGVDAFGAVQTEIPQSLARFVLCLSVFSSFFWENEMGVSIVMGVPQ